MKLTWLFAATFALFFCVFNPAAAQDKLLEKTYSDDVNMGLTLCHRTFLLAIKLADLSDHGRSVKEKHPDADNYQKCISRHKDDIKSSYEQLAAKVKKSSVKLALKEHYIAVITALQGIEPLPDERKMNYERRQGENQSKLDSAWIRFETENP